MAHIIGLKELRENTQKYINRVKKGESFIVLKRSAPAFKLSPVDEWGDEGVWETVADFRDIDSRGVPAGDVAKVLKRLGAKK